MNTYNQNLQLRVCGIKDEIPWLPGFILDLLEYLRCMESLEPAASEEEVLCEQCPVCLFETSSTSTSSSKSSKTSSDTEEDGADFEWVRNIEDSAFVNLLLETIDVDESYKSRVTVFHRTEGAYNHVVILALDSQVRYVIKVPATGNEDEWHESDARQLRSEALLIKYIGMKTKVPVPEIFSWDDSSENCIGAPYILMSALKGMPSHLFWMGKTPNGGLDDLNMDTPSPETGKKRRNFLKNLAYTMAELRTLEFDKIGMVHFDQDPSEENAVPPTVESFCVNNKDTPLVAYSSTSEFFDARLADLLENIHKTAQEDDNELLNNLNYGTFSLYRFMCDSFARSVKQGNEKESFVLAHNDLDFQNIWCNDQGEITGIIDWEDTLTAPRSVGFAALPLFLRTDWTNNYDMDDAWHMPWTLDPYRKFYAQCMHEALNQDGNKPCGDAKYTLKSTLLCWAYDTVKRHERDNGDFIDRLFKEIPNLRAVEPMKFLGRLGDERGFGTAEMMLPREFDALFALKA
ncbi:hypothetical protein BS50DRAFT_583290 [Corynespora cassiicola Philippines]|uniref:Aminoglycoside phosphotransferase domain-containing protein n=1 Tax=Corynespora cassiicola Philippines TaxID=1448308 RepID=A0A2T2P1S4_CORCC|nr:hypothetical protein BS50DRAFT_583290 [Corynespora cassiicola Philippines]